jgi:hypothetical protein
MGSLAKVLGFVLGVGGAAYLATTAIGAQRVGGAPVDAAAARAANARFAGTWKLLGEDVLGFMAYDPAGYVSVAAAPVRPPVFAGTRPTPEEALTAMNDYTAYWGSFAVNDAARVVTHQTFGALGTAVSGTDLVRGFSLSGDRLTLQQAAAADGRRISQTWERVPDLPSLTPTQRRLIGFWKLVEWESRNEKGELLSSNPGETGFIVYTASGHVIVHMMQPYRRRDVGASPTPAETMAAYRSYTGYLGTFTVNEAEQYVVHHIQGTMNSGPVGTNYQRFLEFTGKRVTLKPPVTRNAAGEVHISLTWERLSD